MGWKRHLFSDASKHLIAGHHRPASETPFEWQAGLPDNGANVSEFNITSWTVYGLAIHTRMLKFKTNSVYNCLKRYIALHAISALIILL